ncbi:30S ribosomal protein S18 [Patescibacteria group bacterium]
MAKEETKKQLVISYKDPKALSKHVDDRGKIQPRSKSGLTAKEQRVLTREIKRARHLGLLPYTQTLR